MEMVSTVVQDLKNSITIPCYTTGDRVEITMNMLEKVKPVVHFMGDQKFLCGENITYVDFILFELCDFMDWLS